MVAADGSKEGLAWPTSGTSTSLEEHGVGFLVGFYPWPWTWMEESWRHTASDTEYAHNWLPLLHFSPNSCSPCSPNIFLWPFLNSWAVFCCPLQAGKWTLGCDCTPCLIPLCENKTQWESQKGVNKEKQKVADWGIVGKAGRINTFANPVSHVVGISVHF